VSTNNLPITAVDIDFLTTYPGPFATAEPGFLLSARRSAADCCQHCEDAGLPTRWRDVVRGYVIQRRAMRSARCAILLKAVSHPTGSFPLVKCPGRVPTGVMRVGWLLVSRSPFDAMLLRGEVAAIENPRAASYGDGEMARHTARPREPINVVYLNGKERCVCMMRAPDDPASCIGALYADENLDAILRGFHVGVRSHRL
jgi:hypothetical protein